MAKIPEGQGPSTTELSNKERVVIAAIFVLAATFASRAIGIQFFGDPVTSTAVGTAASTGLAYAGYYFL